MSTFAYEQADRKHRAGHKLSEPEWEALLAGERASFDKRLDDEVNAALDEAADAE